MDLYANAYFGSYNMVYPVLDRRDFMGGILPTIKAQGFSFGCLDSVIALLVFALGCAAQEGMHGRPVAEGSGIRGGNGTTPPALDFFNEARRRIGFVMSSLSLANTQAMLLMAIYFESCCRHTDFWRMAITASDALRAILRLESEWDAHGVDMIRRTFWTCSIIESWYYLDLNLPRPDGEDISDVIALPDFDDRSDFEGQPSIESKYQYSFLSMLSIRGLIYRVFEELHDPSDNGRKEGDKAHHHLIITELSRQLHTWRALLPRDLAWDDSTRIDCNNSTNAPRAENDRERPPLLHVDILLAQLRCRYYYARFMIHRPFVWKVLHEPAAVVAQSPEILDGFVIAVDSMMEWPVAYPPVRDKKRLIPNMENPEVWRFCEEKVGAERIQRSVEVMLDWIGDMRRVDGVAKWAWQTLKPIYGLAD
ncbi:Transcription factor fungi [Macrophomina phaseolina MS6]|uniref:Transcription factor fungi n=1 Tax=Macrophomina phaseolina (strain MS6) TaxID=1126212 RepID=K2RKE7_MACPH|nr:Transcription factor fungi [Macrophomina phaseolina MS6]